MNDLLNLINNIERLAWHASAWRWFDNAMAAGRVPQAVLISGPAGVGKRLFAAQLVRQLLVDAVDVPTEQRNNRLQQLHAGAHPDFRRLAPLEGKKGISVEQVRVLTSKAMLTSQYGGARVIVVDPADLMNASSANALLKCLEEPPAGSVFILLSDRPAGLPITIRSRCQSVNISAPSLAQGAEWLAKQNLTTEHASLALSLASGGPLQAQRLISEQKLPLFNELMAGLAQASTGGANIVAIAGQIVGDGKDPQRLALICDWLQLIVNRMLRLNQGVMHGDSHLELPDALQSYAKALASADIFKYLDRVVMAKSALAGNANPTLTIEALIVPWSRKLRVS